MFLARRSRHLTHVADRGRAHLLVGRNHVGPLPQQNAAECRNHQQHRAALDQVAERTLGPERTALGRNLVVHHRRRWWRLTAALRRRPNLLGGERGLEHRLLEIVREPHILIAVLTFERPRFAAIVVRHIAIARRRRSACRHGAKLAGLGDVVAHVLHGRIGATAIVHRAAQRMPRRRGWRRRFDRLRRPRLLVEGIALPADRHRRRSRPPRDRRRLGAARERHGGARRWRRHLGDLLVAIELGRPHPRHLRGRPRWRWRRLRRGRRRPRRLLDPAAVGKPRLGGGLRTRRIELPRRLGLDFADRLFERQPLARDIALRQWRIDPAQLRDQRRPRALVERTTVFAVVLLQTGDCARYQRIIVSHCSKLTRSACRMPPNYCSNGFCIRIVSSRSGLVDSSVTGQPTSSSIRRTYLIACAGSSAHERARAVGSCQPPTVS